MNAPATRQGASTTGGLQAGEMYRISYAVGSLQQRRVTRSLVTFAGASERRLWNGEVVTCLNFTRPHGRPLSLLVGQVVEARPASLNDRGQLVLVDRQRSRRRRVSVRRLPV